MSVICSIEKLQKRRCTQAKQWNIAFGTADAEMQTQQRSNFPAGPKTSDETDRSEQTTLDLHLE